MACMSVFGGVGRGEEWSESVMDVCGSLVARPRMFHEMNDARNDPDMLFLDRGAGQCFGAADPVGFGVSGVKRAVSGRAEAVDLSSRECISIRRTEHEPLK
jgi:hypothetical protein